MRFLSLLPLVALSALSPASATTDIDTLNYALTLENLEASFYANNPFTSTDYTNAGYNSNVATYISFIAAHEAAHVSILSGAISAAKGTPVQNCTTYPFNVNTSYANVTTFLQTALLLENTGVSAYDGAINTISGAGYQQVAATIATIEARHANFIAQVLNNATGTPNLNQAAFDTALVPTTIVTAVAPYLQGCPAIVSGNFGFSIPQVRNNTAPSTPVQVNNGAAGSVGNNDLNALQYALTLENFENAFYTTFVGQPAGSGGAPAIAGMFNATSFAKYPPGTFAYLQLIASHEQAHVTFLNSTITKLGGNPVQPCTYKFSSITSPDVFVQTAAAIEQVGVSAYDGAINTISNTDVAQAAATIATVEARHSEFLNSINYSVLGGTPSALPNATNPLDPAVGPAATYNLVASTFISSCPANNPVFNLPVVPSPGYNATSSSTGGNGGSSSSGAGSSGMAGSSGASTGGGGIIVGSSSAGSQGSTGNSQGSTGNAQGSTANSQGSTANNQGSSGTQGSSGRGGAASSLVPSFAAMVASVLAVFGLNKRAL